MDIQFAKIRYKDLNAKQKETFNFHKVSAILADYGFSSIPLNDDWQGADFIAQHISGEYYLKVQLKGRLTFDKKYIRKDIYICFPYKESWYLCPHDIVLEKFKSHSMMSSQSWENGTYSFGTLSQDILEKIENYKIL